MHRSQPTTSPSPRSAFTLVELLAVLAIIVLLIGLLLPTLSRARQQANSARCLANLRQIASGFQLYAINYRSAIVPAAIDRTYDDDRPNSGLDNYATLLVSLRYLPAPRQPKTAALTSFGDSVFRCPSGTDARNVISPDTTGEDDNPTSRTDDRNNWFWRRKSTYLQTNLIVDTWYAANTDNFGNGASAKTYAKNQSLWPMRRLVFRPDGTVAGKLSRLNHVRHPTDTVLLFDGLRLLAAQSNRIAPRHNRLTTTNVLFADGHAAPIRTADTPNLTQSQWRGADRSVFAKTPSPKWRLDQ